MAGCWTKKRWPQYDNGEQISLGNRCDLTQDAELPLGFFFIRLLHLPSLHSRLPAPSVFMAFFWRVWFWGKMGLQSLQRVRWRAKISLNSSLYLSVSSISHINVTFLWQVAMATPPPAYIIFLWKFRYSTMCNETHWRWQWSHPNVWH